MSVCKCYVIALWATESQKKLVMNLQPNSTHNNSESNNLKTLWWDVAHHYIHYSPRLIELVVTLYSYYMTTFQNKALQEKHRTDSQTDRPA